MSTDFFGYNRSVGASDSIATSEALTLTINGVGSDLMQSVALQYGQQIQTMFAIGNSNVYFVGGLAQGTLDFERMTNCNSMFDGLKNSDCGQIGTANLGGGGDSSCFCAPGSVTIDDAFLENVRVNARAGSIPVMEGGRIRFAGMSA